MPYYRRVGLPLALLLTLFAGCKSSDKPAQTTTKATRLYAVTVDSAAFFRRGPQAGREPDLKLPRDTVVKLIRPSLGYSKVQVVSSGVQGYLASEEIRPASSTLLASAEVPPPPPDSVATQSSTPAAEQFNLDSTDPRLVPPPEELPDVDLPAPAPEPHP